MPTFYTLDERSPELDPDSFIAPGAVVIGSVSMKAGASIWFNAVLRGDNEPIEIGEYTNIQDGAVVHTDPGFPVSFGKGVTVGHQAMIHGASIGDFSLIGIQAVILNGAQIGRHCLIAAGALVTEGMIIPDGSLVMGSPAKTIKPLPQDRYSLLEKSAQVYYEKSRCYREHLKVVSR